MSLVNSYLNVLEEKSGIGSTTGKSGNELFDSKPKDACDSLENVDGLETPKPGPSVSDTDGTPKAMSKKVQKENLNPFDALLQQVLAQENWELEADKDEAGGEGMELNFSGDTTEGGGNLEMSDEIGEEEGEEGGDPMSEVLDALKAAVAALERVVGGEEEEGSEEAGEEEEGGEEEAGEEQGEENPFGGDMSKEAVEAEELGHALVDLERLAASLHSPKSQVVKGAVPVSKGKAQTAKGGKVDGKPTEFSSNPDELENKKKQDVGGIAKGKTLLDQ